MCASINSLPNKSIHNGNAPLKQRITYRTNLNFKKRKNKPNARIVLLNVIDAERSTSPPYIAVYIFDAPPPGAQPVDNKPIAVDASRFANLAKPYAN